MSGGDECAKAVCDAIRLGYRMIDTAEAYGNEEQVGKGIQRSGINRQELFLVTKVNFRSYENAHEAVLVSMRRLHTDYLDLVLLHWPFGNYYAAWQALEKLYSEERIRAIGISNFDPDRMIDLLSFNRVVPAVNQIETNLFCQRQRERGWMDKYHVRPMAYAPLGQGNRNEMFTLPEVKALAQRYSKTPAQILLRYLLQQGIAVIPKSAHSERLAENFVLFDFALTAEEQATLQRLDQACPLIGDAENPSKVEMAMTW